MNVAFRWKKQVLTGRVVLVEGDFIFVSVPGHVFIYMITRKDIVLREVHP